MKRISCFLDSEVWFQGNSVLQPSGKMHQVVVPQPWQHSKLRFLNVSLDKYEVAYHGVYRIMAATHKAIKLLDDIT